MITVIKNIILILGILFPTLQSKENFIQLPMDIAETIFNDAIPLPKEVFGHSLGEQHTRTDQIIEYFEAIASTSNRVILNEHGRTHEGRRLIHAIVTSAENQKILGEIQANNQKLSSNPKKVSNKNIKKMPLSLILDIQYMVTKPVVVKQLCYYYTILVLAPVLP